MGASGLADTGTGSTAHGDAVRATRQAHEQGGADKRDLHPLDAK